MMVQVSPSMNACNTLPAGKGTLPGDRSGLCDPRGTTALALGLVVVAGGLLNGTVLRLLHGFREGNTLPCRLSEITRAQAVRGKAFGS